MIKRAMVAAAIFLSGCAGNPVSPSPCAAFGPGGRFCLLPPTAFAPTTITHLVQVDGPDGKQSFIGRLQIRRQSIGLAASSLFGPNLFAIHYDGQHIVQQGGNEQLRPVYLLAIMEYVLLPAERVATAIDGLQSKRLSDGARCLLNHKVRVLCITPADADPRSDSLRVDLPKAGVTLQLKPLPNPPEPPSP